MKKLFIITALLFMTGTAWAENPEADFYRCLYTCGHDRVCIHGCARKYPISEKAKPCYEEVWRFDLPDNAVTLNKLLKRGWKLQKPYSGEEEVWLKRRVCP